MVLRGYHAERPPSRGGGPFWPEDAAVAAVCQVVQKMAGGGWIDVEAHFHWPRCCGGGDGDAAPAHTGIARAPPTRSRLWRVRRFIGAGPL
jgi:hypothetical protein